MNKEESELNTPIFLAMTMGFSGIIAFINGWQYPFGLGALVVGLGVGVMIGWVAPPRWQYLFFRKDYGNRVFLNVLAIVLFPFLLVIFDIVIIEQYWIFITSFLFALSITTLIKEKKTYTLDCICILSGTFLI